jgi:hypothetical protein
MGHEIIAILFLSRDIAHREHLRTTSYAAHIALQEFYYGIVDLADKLAEVCQGRHGMMKPVPYLEPEGEPNVADELEYQMDEIESARYKAFDKADTPIQNIVDEIVGLYLHTLYKLRRFK